MDSQGTSKKSCSLRRTARARCHILLVDDDSTSLLIISSILRSWKCAVETAKHPEDALATIRAKNGSFDLVMTDYHMPRMNGLQLQKKVQEEFKLPVIIMSSDDRKMITWKKLDSGDSIYLMKPVKIKELKYVWQHAIPGRKGKSAEKASSVIPRALLPDKYNEPSDDDEDEDVTDDDDFMLPNNMTMREHGNKKQKKVFKEMIPGTEQCLHNNTTTRKTKVVWTTQLHNRFLQAINLVGLDKSVPKTILELMNVPGLTRENVASHLQKYRIFFKRSAEKDAPDSKNMYIHGRTLNHSILAQQSLFPPSSSTRQDVVQEYPLLSESECFASLSGPGFGGMSSILADSSAQHVPYSKQQASGGTNSSLSKFGTHFLPNQVGTQNAPLSKDTGTIFRAINNSSLSNHINQPTRNFPYQQGLKISNQMYQQQLEQGKPNTSGIGYPDRSSVMPGIPDNVQPFIHEEFGAMSNISSASSSDPARSKFNSACITETGERFEVIQNSIDGNGNEFPNANLDYLLSSSCNLTETGKTTGPLSAAEILVTRRNTGEKEALFGTVNTASLRVSNNYDQLLDEGNANGIFSQQVNREIPRRHSTGENTGEMLLPEINTGEYVTQPNALTRQLQSFSDLLLAPWNEEPFTNEHHAMDTMAEEFVSNYSFPSVDPYPNQEQASGDHLDVVLPLMNQNVIGVNPTGNYQMPDNREWDDEDFIRALLGSSS